MHPGVQVVTAGSQCTSNFVFYRPTTKGFDVFIGQAAHCSGLDGPTDIDGCTSRSHPLGTIVRIDGGEHHGVMVYNSWLTMQRLQEADSDVCASNDFALVRIDPADHAGVNPSIPVWGGPTDVSDGLTAGDDVFSYGNSGLRMGLTATSPKRGVSLGDDEAGWSHAFYTLTPGIFGDSGSAILGPDGAAAGVLSTIALAPFAASNNAGDIGLELEYLLAHEPAFAGLRLAVGTEPFNPLAAPIG